MNIPFVKAHGAKNDFLLTWQHEAPGDPAIAVAICNRYTGVGADGWMLVDPTPGDGFDATIRLFNSDGSEPELSGNGTRCAAALLMEHGHSWSHESSEIRIRTGAGVKNLRLLEREGSRFQFEMNMGVPRVIALREKLSLTTGPREATLVDVGNPQCAFIVDDFDFDWRGDGAETERHPRFANRTNVSFVRAVDKHTIEVRFFERGAGETMSSGTGSTGAAVTSIARGLAISPVTVVTPAGNLVLAWGDPKSPVYLMGPAQIIAEGTYRHEIIAEACPL